MDGTFGSKPEPTCYGQRRTTPPRSHRRSGFVLGASIDDLLIPNWLKSYTQDEWGLASTVPVTPQGINSQQRSQMVNTMAALGLPAAMIGGTRAWHKRMQPSPKAKGLCKATEQEG